MEHLPPLLIVMLVVGGLVALGVVFLAAFPGGVTQHNYADMSRAGQGKGIVSGLLGGIL